MPQPSLNVSESLTFEWANVAIGNVPVGTYVGARSSVLQLGVFNSGCWQQAPVTFNLVAATVSQANIISPSGPVSNVNANLAEDDGDLNNDHQTTLTLASGAGASTVITVASTAAFAVGNAVNIGGATTPEPALRTITAINNATTMTVAGLTVPHNATDIVAIPDVAAFAFNGIADGADAYPSFLVSAFPGVVAPQHRYMGVAFVANSLIVILNLVVFNAGDLTALPNHAWMIPAWGPPTADVLSLNDPVGRLSTTQPSNSFITDFCGFTSSTTLFGVSHDNGCTPLVTAQNQAGCTGTGAGFKLRLACDAGTAQCPISPTAPNEAGAFRATMNVAPMIAKRMQWVKSLRDADGDGIDNTLDTCPFIADVWDPYAVQDLANDADDDGIPNTCDTVNSVFPLSTTDQDGDGWSNRGDNCPQVANGGAPAPNVNQFDQDIAPAVAVPDAGPRTDGIGFDCDTHPIFPNGKYFDPVLVTRICINITSTDCSTSIDNDGDGIANASDNCIGGANAELAGFAQSERDLDASGSSDIADVSAVSGAFGKVGGTPGAPAGYEGRLDLNYDSVIDISDVSLISGVFGKAC